MNEIEEKIKRAIAKKAVGYSAKEVVEEYQDDDGVLKLTRRKVTKKHVPPDTQAAKMVMEGFAPNPVENMTDEELEAEKQRLLNSLKENQNENTKND
ncbi:MAG: hypothetical protein J5762_03985 [Clostridia bacterium]|nr:hypothetical protein [Clostridia bacterium]